jgi:hypothetical protein
MITFLTMDRQSTNQGEGSTTNERPSSPSPWRGEEVERAPDGQAEAAADRAEGHVPASRQGEDLAPDEIIDPVEMAPEDARENQEEKRQAAAEDHEADRAQGRGTAPKNL